MRLARTPRGRSVRSLLLTLVAVLVAGLGRPASAQPGDGIPTPITAREINGFAARLGLTPVQRAAIDPIHDAYNAEFAQVRTTMIEAFTRRQRELNMGGPSVTREAVETLLDDQKRIATRIAGIDARFFDQLAPLLTQDQAALLPRVRMARERTRAQSSGMIMAVGGNPTDLSAVLAESGARLTTEEAMLADAVLEPYERRLTRRVVELDEAASGMMLRLIEAMEAADLLGLSQEDLMQDPERMQELMQVMQQAFMDASGEMREKATEIRELNFDTYQQLMRTLPATAGRRFRAGFVQHINMIGAVAGNTASGVWASALGLEDLEPGVRRTIAARLDAAIVAEGRLIDPLIEAAEDQQASIDPMNMDMSGFERIGEQMREVGQTLVAQQAEASRELAELIGQDRMMEARRRMDDGDDDAAAGVASLAGPGGVGASEEEVAEDLRDRRSISSDMFIPARISKRAFDGMLERLEVPEADRAVAEPLHLDYRDAFVELPSLEQARTAQRARFASDGDGDAVQRIDALNAARRAALEEITGLEEQLFDDLELIVGDGGTRSEAIRQERIARRIERFLGSGSRRSMTARGGSQAGDVDLIGLVRSAPLEDGDRRAGAEALASRLEAIAATAERTFSVRLSLERSQALWQQRITELDGSNPMAFQGIYEETMGSNAERIEALRSEMAQLNESALDAVVAAVSPDGARSLQDAWNRAAHPTIFGDPLCVLPHLERALAFEDLDASQRDELQGLLAAYRGEWQRLSEEMVALMESMNVDLTQWQDVDWLKLQEIERGLQELGRARSEQNIRAANRLQLVLREDQLALLGGLPDPEDERLPSFMSF